MSAIRVLMRLRELLDVLVSSPADGEVLTYESSSSKWKNLPAGGGALPSQWTIGPNGELGIDVDAGPSFDQGDMFRVTYLGADPPMYFVDASGDCYFNGKAGAGDSALFLNSQDSDATLKLWSSGRILADNGSRTLFELTTHGAVTLKTDGVASVPLTIVGFTGQSADLVSINVEGSAASFRVLADCGLRMSGDLSCNGAGFYGAGVPDQQALDPATATTTDIVNALIASTLMAAA